MRREKKEGKKKRVKGRNHPKPPPLSSASGLLLPFSPYSTSHHRLLWIIIVVSFAGRMSTSTIPSVLTSFLSTLLLPVLCPTQCAARQANASFGFLPSLPPSLPPSLLPPHLPPSLPRPSSSRLFLLLLLLLLLFQPLLLLYFLAFFSFKTRLTIFCSSIRKARTMLCVGKFRRAFGEKEIMERG